jgi:hypothetical protein
MKEADILSPIYMFIVLDSRLIITDEFKPLMRSFVHDTHIRKVLRPVITIGIRKTKCSLKRHFPLF